jgi:hypothetical protein
MKIPLGTNVTVFVLFFGLSLLDAVESQAWLREALFLLIGMVFLFADVHWRSSDRDLTTYRK